MVLEIIGCPVTTLGPSSITLTLKAWCADPGEVSQIQSDLFESAVKRYQELGIEIPFPYTNVVLHQTAP